LSYTDPSGLGFWSDLGGFLANILGGWLFGGVGGGGGGIGGIVGGISGGVNNGPWNEHLPIGGGFGGSLNTGGVFGSGSTGGFIFSFADPNGGSDVDPSVLVIPGLLFTAEATAYPDPSKPANWKHTAGCFLKGAAVGAGTALVVAAVATVAAPVVGATAVTVGLGALAVAGTASLAVNANSDIRARNWAGVAYDAGSVAGGLAAGFGVGARVARSIDPNATPGWSPQSWKQQRYDPSKGTLAEWMGTGPTHSSGGLATGAGGWLGSLFGAGCR